MTQVEFLDFDGFLNIGNNQDQLTALGKIRADVFGLCLFDPEAVENHMIIRNTV